VLNCSGECGVMEYEDGCPLQTAMGLVRIILVCLHRQTVDRVPST